MFTGAGLCALPLITGASVAVAAPVLFLLAQILCSSSSPSSPAGHVNLVSHFLQLHRGLNAVASAIGLDFPANSAQKSSDQTAAFEGKLHSALNRADLGCNRLRVSASVICLLRSLLHRESVFAAHLMFAADAASAAAVSVFTSASADVVAAATASPHAAVLHSL